MLVFLVIYKDKNREESIFRITKICNELFQGRDVTFIVADTSKEGAPVCKGNIVSLFPGNSHREFGGWQACLDYVNGHMKVDPGDRVIVANDTFYSNYGDEYLVDFNKQTYEHLDTGMAIYGYMDSFPSTVRIDAYSFDTWVRTSFFITNIRTFLTTNLFKFPYAKDKIFSNNETFFRAGDFLSENYKHYLRCWLIKNQECGEEFKVKWHSAQPLTNDNIAFLQDKAMCILTEHYLTWHARVNNVEIIKVN